ncbi:hypothetical protein M3Y96_00991800 [Aphelenchoides besseyi]|nr:hypothetical protein M3Y96_00991800 [Aphelenchoides besseyi]
MMGNQSGQPKKEETITVTFRSIMGSGNPVAIVIRKDGTVRDLKIAYANRVGIGGDRQTLIYEGKELSDDDAPLSHYGIVSDCTVQLSMRLESGIREKTPPIDPNVIVIVPGGFGGVANADGLREALRNMQAMPNQIEQQPQPQDQSYKQWTPGITDKRVVLHALVLEKQMEHELTRNRMRELLRRRRRTKTPGSPNHSSNCGSIGRSPLHSGGATPTNELMPQSSGSSTSNLLAAAALKAQNATTVVEVEEPMTVKELQKFLDPPETKSEMDCLRRELLDPPNDLFSKPKSDEKTNCNVCHRRLSFSQQTMLCQCGLGFCSRHKNPEEHKCSADYKIKEPSKEQKEQEVKEKKDEAESRKGGD